MTFDDPKLWLDLAQWVTTVIIGLYVWQAGRHRASREQIEKLRNDHAKRLDSHASQLTVLTESVRHQPSAENVTELALSIERINGDIKALTANLDGFKDLGLMLRSQVNRIDEFLKRSSA